MNYKNKKILIMGLGLYPKGSGFSALKYLHSKGAVITVTDLKSKEQLSKQLKRLKKFKNIKYVLGKHRIIDFKNKDLIIKNPGVPKSSPFLIEARKNKITILNDVTLFLQNTHNPIIGVTGTRGKSTTSSLIYELVKTIDNKVKLGGNIKVSPLNFLHNINDKNIIVLELSSWMLNGFSDIKFSPQISVVTNIMPDHLNSYKNMNEYVNDKINITKFQRNCDILILNKDNIYYKNFATKSIAQKYFVTIDKTLLKNEDGIFLNKKNQIIIQEDKKKDFLINKSDIKLLGKHNVYNVMSAILVAYLSGVTKQNITKTIKSFQGIDSRLQKIRSYKGIDFINDTTSTTPDASIAALNSFSQKVILIAGGSDKKLDYKEFIKKINKNVKFLILLPGVATEKILSKVKIKNIYKAKDMKQATLKAWELAKKGDIILLSPGSTSFGLFKNEFDRGEQFNKIVKKIQ